MFKLVRIVGYPSILIIIGLFITRCENETVSKNSRGQKTFRLFYSGDLLGRLQPCG